MSDPTLRTSKERATDKQLDLLIAACHPTEQLHSEIVASWLLRAICEELKERRAAPEPCALQERFDIVQEQLEKVVKERNALREAAEAAELRRLAPPPGADQASVRCNCAGVAPTMPTYRTEHLPTCPCSGATKSAALTPIEQASIDMASGARDSFNDAIYSEMGDPHGS